MYKESGGNSTKCWYWKGSDFRLYHVGVGFGCLQVNSLCWEYKKLRALAKMQSQNPLAIVSYFFFSFFCKCICIHTVCRYLTIKIHPNVHPTPFSHLKLLIKLSTWPEHAGGSAGLDLCYLDICWLHGNPQNTCCWPQRLNLHQTNSLWVLRLLWM